ENLSEGVETRFDDTKTNDARRPNLRNANSLLDLVSFVDTEMGRALRVVLQRYGMLPYRRSADCRGGCSVCFRQACPGIGQRAIAVIDIEVGDSEVATVELAGEEKKISCQE